MHIAFDGGHDDRALGGALGLGQQFLFRLDKGDEVGHRLLHNARGFDHLWQEHFARAKQVSDNVHPVHQRAFDDFDGAAATVSDLAAHFLGVINDMRIDPFDKRVFEAFGNLPSAPFGGLLVVFLAFALEAFGQVYEAFGCRLITFNFAHKDYVFARLAKHGVDGVINIELPRVDDRHVEPCGDGVIEEDRVHRAAHGLVSAEGEGEVRKPAAGFCMGALCFDFRACLNEV